MPGCLRNPLQLQPSARYPHAQSLRRISNAVFQRDTSHSSQKCWEKKRETFVLLLCVGDLGFHFGSSCLPWRCRCLTRSAVGVDPKPSCRIFCKSLQRLQNICYFNFCKFCKLAQGPAADGGSRSGAAVRSRAGRGHARRPRRPRRRSGQHRPDRRFRAVKKAGRQIRSAAARFQYSERDIAIRYELESIRFRVWKSIQINVGSARWLL